MKILLVEDEKLIRITLTDSLRKSGFEVVACETGAEGMACAEKEGFDVVVTDLRLPGSSGMDILKLSREKFPNREIIVMTAYATVETAVEALKLGAYDYLVKPFSPEELVNTLNHIDVYRKVISENRQLRQRLRHLENREIIGTSAVMRKLKETLQIVGPQDFNVLISGESGTGKEMAARALHSNSPRASAQFVAVNLAVIPETLQESELFGYEKGSFSGAMHQHQGYFERANKGTLFIDDIDDMPLAIQVKLLRALQEREILRLGGNKQIPIDIRVVCATKRDLAVLVESGEFRRDLYFRLNVVPIDIPALRNRMEDLPDLLDHFLQKHGADDSARKRAYSLLPQLQDYSWPGNVRELENIVQRIIALPNMVDLELLQSNSPPEKLAVTSVQNNSIPSLRNLDYEKFIEEKNREIIGLALARANNNVSNAAKLLNLPRTTLRNKLEKYFADRKHLDD